MQDKNVLELNKIIKSYSGVQVLQEVSFDVKQGEIHALVGANGAGKSTLIKTVSGAIVPDSGEIIYKGHRCDAMTPQLSNSLGIEVIYQEFNLVPSLSVAENIYIGNRISGKKLFSQKILESKADKILEMFGHLGFKSTDLVKNLSVASQQIVEVAKALSRDVQLLILDEPTAPLGNKEVDVLFKVIRSLREQGVSIIYISHRLEEVFELSDRITVLRDGKKVVTVNTKDTNRKQLITYMINSELEDEYPDRAGYETDRVLLKVDKLCGKGFQDISFQVKKGEIFGIVGLVGAKRTEVIRAVFGADPLVSGDVYFDGELQMIKSPTDAIRLGIVMVPEDRKTQGVVLNLSIKWNITMAILRFLSRFTKINFKKENEVVKNYKSVLSIKMASEEIPVTSLSGGNQQKVVLSKWLASEPKLMILDEPTRGIDVGAKKEIYKLINALADQGIGIILVSSEMDEMIGLSDRMVVLAEGKMVGFFERDEFDKQNILDYASGNN